VAVRPTPTHPAYLTHQTYPADPAARPRGFAIARRIGYVIFN